MNSTIRSRSGVLLTIIGLHVALLAYAVISAKHVDITPPEVPQVMVAQLIQPSVEKPAPPQVQPTPPVEKPKPQVVKPTPPVKTVVKERTDTPVLTTESAAPVQQARAEPAPAAPAPVAQPTPPAPAPVAITPPRFNAAYLNNPPPAYPPMARRMGDEGKVMLRVFVTPEGTAGEVRVLTSSGSSMFDDAALAAVKQWKFVPAKQGENAVAAWVQVPIVFKLG